MQKGLILPSLMVMLESWSETRAETSIQNSQGFLSAPGMDYFQNSKLRYKIMFLMFTYYKNYALVNYFCKRYESVPLTFSPPGVKHYVLSNR
jgi:hypothetical protein